MNKLQAIGAAGLLTSERHVDAGKSGFAVRTNNVLIRKQGIWEPRFGLETLGASSASTDRMYYDTVNRQVLRASTSGNVLERWTGSAWSSMDSGRRYSGYAPGNGIPWALSSTGLRRLDATTSYIGYVPEGLAPTLTAVSPVFGDTWLPRLTSAAYRIVWGIEVDDRFLLGAPSGRIIISNTLTTPCSVQTNFPIPDDITSSYFYQIYRTDPSADLATDPGDNMYLVYEAFPTSGQISAGEVEIYDRVPLGGGGEALYTNQGSDGSGQGAFPCECATGPNGEGVLSTYADVTFASNYQSRSSISLYLLAAGTQNGLNAYDLGTDYGATLSMGSPDVTVTSMPGNIAVGMWIDGPSIPANTTVSSFVGTTITMSNAATGTTGSIVAGDRLVIAGQEYRAGITENPTSGIFLVSTNPSDALRIQETTESFVRVFNRYPGNTFFYAQVIGNPDQIGTPVQITAITDRASTYTIQAFGNVEAWSPSIAAATTIPSEGRPELLTWSKPGEPHAWPPLENALAMPGSARIVDHVGLRSALIIATEQGFYRLTGSYGDFSLELIDASAIPVSSETNPGAGLVVVDNVAYALCTKGLVAVTETGTQLIRSTPDQIINAAPYAGRLSAHLGDSIVFVPQGYGTFAYHASFGGFTSLDDIYRAGVYDIGLSKMVVQHGSDSRRARSSQGDALSYFDTELSVTISAVSGNVVTVSSVSGVEPGDTLAQDDAYTCVLAIEGLDLTVADGSLFETGDASILIGYDCEVIFAPVAAGMGVPKNMVDACILFDGADVAPGSMGTFNNSGLSRLSTFIFRTDNDDTYREVSSFEPSPNHPSFMRTYFPPESKRCNIATMGARWRCSANKARFVGVEANYTQLDTGRTGR